MAEELPSPELLRELIERLDLLERVLGSNTARLHSIEQQLGIAHQAQSLLEPIIADNGGTHPAAPEVTTPDLKIPPATTPTPIGTQAPISSDQTWPQSPPEHTWLRPGSQPPPAAETSASYWWMNESSSRTDATKKTAVASGPSLRVENSAVVNEAARARVVHEEKRRDLESLIGGRWFSWIGIIAVTFGIAFFLKFAFDKQWIGPAGRVSLSALVGVALLYIGERLRARGLKSYAYVLSGGGVLILYLSDYAAYNFYHLIGQTPAFLLMALVTATTVLLSVRLNALPIAILGLVGGFLTPVLLSTGVDNEAGLFLYVSLLDAGVLAVAYSKRWRSLDFLSFAATVAITLGWAFKFFNNEKLWPTLVFLTVFFVLYSLLAVFHNVLRGRPTRWFDVLLVIANATVYFGFSYLMLTEAGLDQATPATQALLVSVFFTGLFYTTWRWSPDDRLLRYSYVGAAVTFLTIAVAIQLELHWVTIAWSVEALMLTWVGFRSGESAARHAGLAVFCVAVGHWFAWDMLGFAYGVDPSFVPLLNRRALSCAVLVGAIACAARLYRRADQIGDYERSPVKTLFTVTANALVLTLLSLDLNDYFVARLSNGGAQTELSARIENARQFSISALWTLYAGMALAIGVLRRSIVLRFGGLLLLLAAIGNVVFFDSSFYAAPWHLPVVNQTFMAYALLVAVLALSAWLYGRATSDAVPERSVVRPGLLAAANLLALGALSLEVFGYYERLLAAATLNASSAEIFSEFQESKLFTLALVWTIYATCAFQVGAWRKVRACRFGALLLLTLTLPLVLATLGYFDAPWHALVFNRTLAAFAIFVAALWLIVRTYARSSEQFAEAWVVRPVATVAANLLSLIALSAQAAGYYDAKINQELSRTGAVAFPSNVFPAPLRNLELAKQLSLSVVWALYASGLLVAGRLRRLRLLRVMGLALLSLTTLKAFFWDLSSLDRVYRIVSFIMLGAILLIVSYFYTRSQQRVEEEYGAVGDSEGV